MKANKLLKTLAASAMSLALMASVTVMPAMAADVKGGVTISFDTVLDMTNATGASVPNVTFDYTITAGDPVTATGTTTGVLAGVQAENIQIGDAVFAPGDGTATATKTVNLNFANVTFSTVGIYRYTITAVNPNDADITMDADETRTMDVYVTNKEGGLEISHVVLMKEPVNIDQTGNYVGGADSKSTGFTNVYTTYDLTLDKVVAGTMGDKTKQFDFTINFTGGTDGETMKYGDTTITFANGGTASATVKLADDTAAAVITGIPSEVSYTVVENIEKTEGYTTTAKVNSGDVSVTSDDHAQTVTQQTMGKQDNAVEVTNTRNAVTPTGIIMNIAPYALMVVIAVAGVAVFMRKRVEE